MQSPDHSTERARYTALSCLLNSSPTKLHRKRLLHRKACYSAAPHSCHRSTNGRRLTPIGKHTARASQSGGYIQRQKEIPKLKNFYTAHGFVMSHLHKTFYQQKAGRLDTMHGKLTARVVPPRRLLIEAQRLVRYRAPHVLPRCAKDLQSRRTGKKDTSAML